MTKNESVFPWRETLVILILALAFLAVLPVRLDDSSNEAQQSLQSENVAPLIDTSPAHLPSGEEEPLQVNATVYVETWQPDGAGVELYARSLDKDSEVFVAVGEPSYQFFDVTSTGEAIRFRMDEATGTEIVSVDDRDLFSQPIEKGQILSARVSPDGTMLAYTSLCGLGCTADGANATTTISVVNLQTGKLLSSVTKNGFVVVRQWIANNRLFLSPEVEVGEGEPSYDETYVWHIWNRTYTTIGLEPDTRSFDVSDDGTFIAYTVARYNAETKTISSAVVRKPLLGGKAVRVEAPDQTIYSNVHWSSSQEVVFNKTTVEVVDWDCAYAPCLQGKTDIWASNGSDLSLVLPEGEEGMVADASTGIVFYHDASAPSNRDVVRAYSRAEGRSIGVIDSPRYVHVLRVISEN